MAFELPRRLKPAGDFVVQVIVGMAMFLVLFLAAVFIALVVKQAEQAGLVPAPMVTWAHYAEQVIFAVDLFCFGLFLLSEVFKFVRALWSE